MNLFVVEDEYTYYFRLYILGYEPFCRGRWIHILFTFIYLRSRTFFCVEDEYTYYFRLYILGYEPFCCVGDEYTYYLRLYILGHDPFCCGRWMHILFTFIYLRSWTFLCVEDEYTYYLRLYILGYESFLSWKMNAHIIYVYIS